jgi:protein-tyrosine-phosphatase
LAAVMLRREGALLGIPLEIVSAGFGDPGFPPTTSTLDTASDLDLDLRAHRSQTIDAATLAQADLVIGMERVHVREAVVLEPSVWRHAFTLRELVRRAEDAPPRSPSQSLQEYLEGLSADRGRMDLMGSSPEDDIADPTTDWTIDHAATAALIDDLLRRFLARAFPQ